MAQINDVVAEFRTIADAFTGIATFDYDHISTINTEHLRTAKPILILESKPATVIEPTNDHSFKTYTLTFGIYDDYNRNEQVSTDFEDKEAELERKMEQFLQEFVTRSLGISAAAQPWTVIQTSLNVDVEKAYPFGSSKLIATIATMIIRVDSSCVAGIFNY